MVRHIHRAVLPMSGGTIKVSNRKHINGRGYGSVLLDGGEGGYGGASSYSSLNDYINTTGLNPMLGQPSQSSGRGLASMNSKLENLLVKTKKPTKKEKNITFHM